MTGVPARVRVADDRLRRHIRALAGEWVQFPIGNVSNGERVEQFGTYSFTTYTTGGVSIAALASATDVLMSPWTDAAGTVYFFKWSSGAMKVTDWTGLELGAGTDISAIASHPYRAIMSAALTPTSQARLTGSGRIYAVEFEVSTQANQSATNYWTVTARIRRMNRPTAQTTGETLGSAATSRLTIAAQDPVALYYDEHGVAFADSDRLVFSAAASGSPAPLMGAVAWARIARELQ